MTRKRSLCTAPTFLDFSLITLLSLFDENLDMTLMPSLSKCCVQMVLFMESGLRRLR